MEYNNIQITHVVNPHKFWFKTPTFDIKFIEFDISLQNHLKVYSPFGGNNSSDLIDLHTIEISEVVAYFDQKWQRWFRGAVQDKSSDSEVSLFLVDFGFPIVTNISVIRKIPIDFQLWVNASLKCGAINQILPATAELDVTAFDIQMSITEEWSKAAIDILQKIINESSHLCFTGEFELNGQLFGKLYAGRATANVKQEVRKILIKLQHAVFVENITDKLYNRPVSSMSNVSNNFHRCISPMSNPCEIYQRHETSEKVVAIANQCEFKSEVQNPLDKLNDDKQTDQILSPIYNQCKNQVTHDHKPSIRKTSTQSENSCFSESRNIMDYSESDIDSCISSSPHLAKILNKMRKIRNREHEKIKKFSINSTPEISPNKCSNNHDTLNTNTTEPEIDPLDNTIQDSLCDEASNVDQLDTKSMNQTDNSSVSLTEAAEHREISNDSTNLDKSFGSLGKVKSSDTSSIETSTTVTHNSAQHSNLADNESSHSNQGNNFDKNQVTKTPLHKVFTKKSSDSANKYGKLSDASNSSMERNYRVPLSYDSIKHNNKNKKYTFFEKEQKQVVLVHGHTPVTPVESLDQVNFSKSIHQALDKLMMNRLFRIDSYTWPHCLNGTSFVVIGAERTGKTISYLPPLINLILMEEEDKCVIDGVGPIALIVAPTSEKVANIFHICQEFNKYLDNKLTICKGHNIPSDKLAMSLLHGVHILIATPGCLNRIFDSSVNFINSERIKFLVIDDYHLMTDQISLIKKIIRLSCILNPETELYEQQIIVTSSYWHNTFMSMLHKTNNSFICIGSYMESAYYAKQDIKLLFMRQEDKLNELKELLSKKDYRLKHTLIVCRTSSEVDSIVKHLSDWNMEVIGCSLHSSTDIIIRVINDWNDQNGCFLNIVVCTDDILPELHLNRVKVLIHYSLSATWSKFQYRYSTFFATMPNLLKNENLETKSIVLIDETNNSELPRFIDFLKIHGVKHINPTIEHISNEIRSQKEIEKETLQIDFCKYILKSGVCQQQNTCQFRHRFTDLDKSIIQLDIKKYIKCKVAHVHSPAHFSVHILSTRDTLDHPWIDFDKENHKIFNIKFKLHYSDKMNHMQHTVRNVGELCTINMAAKYYRCKIINIGEKQGVLSDRRVLVKVIDIGITLKTTESRLLLLPEQFKSIPPQLVDIRIGGLVPIDNEIKWDYESTRYVGKYFDKREQNQELFLEANACFIISDTIYVNNMVYKRDLGKFGGGELEVYNYNTDAVKKQIGIFDEKGFNRAKDLVRSADFKLFELDIQIEKEEIILNPSSPQTAPSNEDTVIVAPETSVENGSVANRTMAEKPLVAETINTNHDGAELSETALSSTKSTSLVETKKRNLGVSLSTKIESINLCCFNSPSNFFVQKLSSLSVINTRLYDIQEYLTESNHKKLENFAIGDICLVFYDGYYDRGEIISINNNNDDIFVNLCDIGFNMKYKKDDIFDIEDAIKNQPFEAIECQLFGLKAVGDSTATWDEKCVDDIYDYINDNYIDHYVKRVLEIQSDNRPKYSVMLCGVNGDKGMEIINKVLIEKGWAEYNEEVRMVFDQSCEALLEEFNENIMSVVRNDDSSAFDEEGFANNFTIEECMELFNFPAMLPNDTSKDDQLKNFAQQNGQFPRATITEITENDISYNDEKNIVQQTIATDPIVSYDDGPPPLVSCYNLLPLETLWHQDATSVTLKINVTDHVEYRIEVHKRLLNVCVEFDNQSYREITINLFGIVNIKNFVNTIVGNYLKIVLNKSIQMNLLWPRLLLVDMKVSWLRYNYDSFKDDDLNDDYIQYKIKCSESSSDIESDENLDEDDECDPLSTQYNFVENKYFDEDKMKVISNS